MPNILNFSEAIEKKQKLEALSMNLFYSIGQFDAVEHGEKREFFGEVPEKDMLAYCVGYDLGLKGIGLPPAEH